MARGLLIITQVVDTRDPVLGFFHEWIARLAPHFSSVTVICLREGTHALPDNVSVWSLGKEHGHSRLMYLKRFYSYIWSMRAHYDSVLIHMNEEYAVLGGPLWWMLGKKVSLWRNFHSGTWKTPLAAWWCSSLFYTSAHSYTARYRKGIRMPVGVDGAGFAIPQGVTRIPRSILSLGRIAPVKRIHVLIDALSVLHAESVAFTAHIYGDALPKDTEYLDQLKRSAEERGLTNHITFHPGIPNTDTPKVYQSHLLFVNMSPSGMYDKTIFEAAAAGVLPVSSSDDYAKIADPRLVFADTDVNQLTERLRDLLQADQEEIQELRSRSIELARTQDLGQLTTQLAAML